MKKDIITQVVQMVGEYMRVREEFIFRKYPYGRVRHAQSLVFYTLKIILGIPYNQFYIAFGHCDHTTVIKRVNQHVRDSKQDQQTRDDINYIINQIKKLSHANLLHYYGNTDSLLSISCVNSLGIIQQKRGR